MQVSEYRHDYISPDHPYSFWEPSFVKSEFLKITYNFEKDYWIITLRGMILNDNMEEFRDARSADKNGGAWRFDLKTAQILAYRIGESRKLLLDQLAADKLVEDKMQKMPKLVKKSKPLLLSTDTDDLF